MNLTHFALTKAQTFDLLRLVPGVKVADVGCGTGVDARILSDLVGPGGQTTGFDLSEAMLAQARDRHSTTPGLDFKRAPSDELGVPDGSFDGIRADRVLIHVPSPSATLKEMMRVTKPGGRIVVSEPDMPGCWIASDDHPTTNRIMQAIANSCVTPYLARDLWTMFRDAGLQDVSLTVQPLVAFDPESVGKILDFKGVVAGMVAKNLLHKEEAEIWISEFVERGRLDRFVAGVSIMIVAGTNPMTVR
jgi:ubiquinone/menaquinone biosynthesis C-methylase UbiE